MKNFFLKLFLLSILCLSLHACTADEITSTPSADSSETITAKDGEPILSNPK